MSYKPTPTEIAYFHKAIDELPSNIAKSGATPETIEIPNDQTIANLQDLTAEEIIKYRTKYLTDELFKQLRLGKIPIDRKLDLHHLTLSDAASKTLITLKEATLKNHHLLLIIHGKGIHSPNGKPLIKMWLNDYLKKHPQVIAFHSAQPHHGGSGALYALIK